MIREALSTMFNWKKHPHGVFYTAIPLFMMAALLVGYRAYLELKLNGDPWYMVIALVGLALLLIGLWPVRSIFPVLAKKL